MDMNVQKSCVFIKVTFIKPNKKLWVSGHLLTLAVCCCCRFLTTTLDFKMISWAQHISTWSHWNTRGLYATPPSPSHKQFTSHTDNKPVHLLCTLFTNGIKVTCLTTRLMGKFRKCSCKSGFRDLFFVTCPSLCSLWSPSSGSF